MAHLRIGSSRFEQQPEERTDWRGANLVALPLLVCRRVVQKRRRTAAGNIFQRLQNAGGEVAQSLRGVLKLLFGGIFGVVHGFLSVLNGLAGVLDRLLRVVNGLAGVVLQFAGVLFHVVGGVFGAAQIALLQVVDTLVCILLQLAGVVSDRVGVFGQPFRVLRGGFGVLFDRLRVILDLVQPTFGGIDGVGRARRRIGALIGRALCAAGVSRAFRFILLLLCGLRRFPGQPGNRRRRRIAVIVRRVVCGFLAVTGVPRPVAVVARVVVALQLRLALLLFRVFVAVVLIRIRPGGILHRIGVVAEIVLCECGRRFGLPRLFGILGVGGILRGVGHGRSRRARRSAGIDHDHRSHDGHSFVADGDEGSAGAERDHGREDGD